MFDRLSRRAATAVLLSLLGAAAGGGRARAQTSDKTLRIVVPFGPGGGSDVLARLLQARLAEAIKTTVVIDNRPGAGGTLGADLVAKAVPDGHTLLLSDASVATIGPSLYPKLPYATRDLTPVSSLAQFAHVLVAPSRLAASTLAELVAQQRATPTALSIGSSGNGASPHLTAEMLKSATGLALTHVPYKGSGPAINDVAGGQIDLLFTGYATVSQLIKAGKLKALAVTALRRLPELPQVPTVAESGYPGFESWISQALFAPAGTPRETVRQLNTTVAAILRQPEVLERMKQQGLEPFDNSPEQFAAWIDQQSRQWARVIRDAGVKPD